MNAFTSHYFWVPLLAVLLLLFVVPAVRGWIARRQAKPLHPPSFLDRLDVEAAGRRAMEKTFPPKNPLAGGPKPRCEVCNGCRKIEDLAGRIVECPYCP